MPAGVVQHCGHVVAEDVTRLDGEWLTNGTRTALDCMARVDFAWPELGVFLEFDGKVKYEALLKDGERASDVVIREKRREEMICHITGWRCIRILWADLLDPTRLVVRIRAVLAGQPGAA